MSPNTLLFVRGVILVAACFTLLVVLLTLLGFWLTGSAHVGTAILDLDDGRFLASLLQRGQNQLIAILFTTVAIAVPLTANMYSPKFLDLFIKDRVSMMVLGFMLFTSVLLAWWGYVIAGHDIPAMQIKILLGMLLVCFAVIIPYLQYIFRFLHPNILLERLGAEIAHDLSLARKKPQFSSRARERVAENIENIANIAIRSVERGDRNTAIASVQRLEGTLESYWHLKAQLPPAWFLTDQNFFLGFSHKAVEELSLSKSWVEMKTFSQLRQIVGLSLSKTHELVSAAAKAIRHLGLKAEAKRDNILREMIIEYFNTFVRLAIKARDSRSVFAIFDHYRTYAERMNAEYPDLVDEIAFYFNYYGQVAHETKLPFVVESIAHDLGMLVQHAFQINAANKHALLQRFLQYESAEVPSMGVKQAQAILASYFLRTEQPEAARLIGLSFLRLSPEFISRLRDDLMQVRREKYWEVNERRLNFNYVDPEYREQLSAFFDSLQSKSNR